MQAEKYVLLPSPRPLPSRPRLAVYDLLRLEQHFLHLHKFTYRLDGDNICFGLNKDLGFDDALRNENIWRIGEVAKLFTDVSAVVLTAFTSSCRKDRDTARELHKAGLEFVEVR